MATASMADQFPSKPIKIIVPASAGTSIDVTSRFFAEALTKRLNHSVVVENKPGAGGLLAYTSAAKAAPDGYTLILTGIPLYLLPLFSEAAQAPFDSVRDFAPVARVARVPFAIAVGADSPHKNMGDLLKAMQTQPGEVTYSSQGIGSSAHLCSVVVNDLSKTKAQHISYKETTVAVTDVVAGRIAFTCQTSVGVLPLVNSGRLRLLAVTGDKRWENMPDIPTVAESGIPGLEVSSQLDFMAPARTPASVLKFLSDHMVQIAQTPAFQAFCEKQMMTVSAVGTSGVASDMPREAERWKRIVNLARSS
jgi:tripartite-type tricarboxylate transporter receptor subunit TctC